MARAAARVLARTTKRIEKAREREDQGVAKNVVRAGGFPQEIKLRNRPCDETMSA